MVKITYKGETRNIPKSYLPDTLSKAERQKQIKSIFEGKDKPRPKADIKKRKSKYTQAFDKKYNPKSKKLKDISKEVKIPEKALQEVYKKGVGAYRSSGSRPNQTEDSWAMARVYSYIMGGKTRKVDKHITDKYKVKFKEKSMV